MNIETQSTPASVGSERAILGSVLLDPNCLFDAAWVLKPECFSLDSHRRIYAAMVEMFDASKPIDLVTLSEHMRVKKNLEACGGASFIAGLTDGVPSRANISHYVNVVRDHFILRTLLNSIRVTEARILDGGQKPSECITLLQEAMIEVGETGKQPRHISELMNDALNEIDRLRTIEGESLGATFDFKPLDDVTTGIRDDEFWVIGARPNVGKTPFGMQIALANARAGRNVMVFSLEMSDLQLAMRCLIHAGVAEPWKLRDPRRMASDEVTQVGKDATRKIADLPLWVLDVGSLTIGEFKNRVRYAKRRLKLDLWVADYLQLFEGDGKTPYEKVSNTAKGMRSVIRETKVPGIALSQLNRNAKDPAKKPDLADLRESGVIEQEANAVVMIHRPEITDEQSPEFGQMSMEGEFILAKVREGVKGPEPFYFDDMTLTFKPR